MSTATLKLDMSITWSVSNSTSNSSSMAATSAMWPTESHASRSRYLRFSTSTSPSRSSASTKTSRSLGATSDIRQLLVLFARAGVPRLYQGREVAGQRGVRETFLALQPGPERLDRRLVDTAAGQAHDVDAGDARRVADGDGERADLAPHRRAHADHRAGPDHDLLVQDRAHAEVRAVPDVAVPTRDGVGRDRHAVADQAVVGDVGVAEEVAVAADGRCPPGPLVDTHVLADAVAAADDHAVAVVIRVTGRRLAPGRRVRAAAVLAGGADRHVGADPVAVADPGRPDDHGERPDHVVVAEFDAFAEDGGRVDAVGHGRVSVRRRLGTGRATAPGNVWPAFMQGGRAQNRRLTVPDAPKSPAERDCP